MKKHSGCFFLPGLVRSLAIFLILTMIFLIDPTNLKAHLVISEVLPRPQSGETEKIEIYNPDDYETNLEGFYLMDKLQTPSIIYQFPSNQTLSSKQLLIVTLNKPKLNNDQDGLMLKNNQGEIIDQLDYFNAPANKSYTLVNLEQHIFAWKDSNFGVISLTTPTPLLSPTATFSPTITPLITSFPTVAPTPTVIPTPTTTQVYLELTEVMACPNPNEPEWVELYNPSSQALTTSLTLTDQADNHLYFDQKTFPALSYQLLTLERSILNNSGDEIWLTITSNNQLISHLSLPPCQPGSSLALVNNTWQKLTPPSPGQTNFLSPTAKPTATINPTPTQPITTTPTPSALKTSKQLTDKVLPENNQLAMGIDKQQQEASQAWMESSTLNQISKLPSFNSPPSNILGLATSSATSLPPSGNHQPLATKRGIIYLVSVIMASGLTLLASMLRYVKP